MFDELKKKADEAEAGKKRYPIRGSTRLVFSGGFFLGSDQLTRLVFFATLPWWFLFDSL